MLAAASKDETRTVIQNCSDNLSYNSCDQKSLFIAGNEGIRNLKCCNDSQLCLYGRAIIVEIQKPAYTTFCSITNFHAPE